MKKMAAGILSSYRRSRAYMTEKEQIKNLKRKQRLSQKKKRNIKNVTGCGKNTDSAVTENN